MNARAAALVLGIAAAALPGPAARAQEPDVDAKRLLTDPDPEVRRRGLRALQGHGDEETVKAVVPLLDDKDPWCRDYAAVKILSQAKGPAAAKEMAERASRVSTTAGRLAAADALAGIQEPAALAGLHRLAGDRDARVRETALDALGRLAPPGAPDVEARLRLALADSVPGVRAAALEALVRGKAADAADLLEKAAADAAPGLRTAAASLLAAHLPDRFAASFAALAADPDWGVRWTAARGAATLSKAPPMENLLALLEDPRIRVADAAHDSLREISGLDLPPLRKDWSDWWERAKGSWKGGAGTRLPDAERPSLALYHGLPFRSNAVLFVVDLSGSMDAPLGAVDPRPRIVVAAEELARTLNAMPDGASADLMAFMLEPARALGKLLPLKGGNRAKIGKWLDRQARGKRGDMGGALVASILDGEADTVLFLGDGNPSAGDCLFRERILERIRQARRLRPVAIHAVACGAKPADRQFLEAIAEAAGGTCVER